MSSVYFKRTQLDSVAGARWHSISFSNTINWIARSKMEDLERPLLGPENFHRDAIDLVQDADESRIPCAFP